MSVPLAIPNQRRAWCLAALLVTGVGGASGAATMPPGYVQATIPLNGPPVGLAFDADGVLYALEAANFGSNQATLRAIMPDGSLGSSSTVVGDDPVNLFVGGMTYDPLTDRLLITDNTGDGRLYAVGKDGARETLATGIPTIAVPVVRSTGEILVSTALGDNMGQVLQVDRENGATSVALSGLDFGGGLAFDTGGDLLVLEADAATFRGRLRRLPVSETPAGLVFGTAELLLDDLQSSYATVVDSEGDVFATGSGGLYRVALSPADEILFHSNDRPDQIATALAFEPGAEPFEPFAGRGGGRLALNADFGFATQDSFVTLLVPTVAGDYSGDGQTNGDDYQLWQNSFGSTSLLKADGNRDGIVDAADYTVWRDHLGASLGVAAFAAAEARSRPVPEAASLVLMSSFGLAMCVLGGCPRGRRRESASASTVSVITTRWRIS